MFNKTGFRQNSRLTHSKFQSKRIRKNILVRDNGSVPFKRFLPGLFRLSLIIYAIVPSLVK